MVLQLDLACGAASLHILAYDCDYDVQVIVVLSWCLADLFPQV